MNSAKDGAARSIPSLCVTGRGAVQTSGFMDTYFSHYQ